MSDLHTALSRYYEFSSFRPGQEEAIRSLLAGDHTLVVMPTGAGKSLVYQLAALCLPQPAVTLVISPLIALMKDQVDSLRRRAIPATYINSSLPAGEQSRRLHAVATGTYRLIYVAPERLRSTQLQQILRQLAIGLLVIDEAHCISHWGHDFRPDYRRIAQARHEMGQPLTVALTATATKLVQDDIVTLLGMPDAKRIVTGFNRPNLSFEVVYAADEAAKQQVLVEQLQDMGRHHLNGTAIIYVGTRREAEEVAEFVATTVGVTTRSYHAGLPPEQRTAIQDTFLTGTLPVVVATNAFGMGIDRPDVRLVIHYTVPGTLEAYYQEAGRAGRDGQPARAVLLYAPQDRLLQQWFIEKGMLSFDDLRQLYQVLSRSNQAKLHMSLEHLAQMARLDAMKARMGLAHLERAHVIQQAGDEGGQMHISLAPWDANAVAAIAETLERYAQHRQHQLDQMTDYAEADGCRRRILLNYFSDNSPADAARCCDNCLARASQVSSSVRHDVHTLSRAERAALIILDTVHRLPWNVGRRRIAEILKGSHAKEMTETYRKQHYYGRFGEFTGKAIEQMIGSLITQGYLKIVGGDMPVVALSERGRHALHERAPIPLELPGEHADSGSSGRSRKQRGMSSGSTVEETAALLQQGLCPAEIAAERGLTERTIFNHLGDLISAGKVELAAVVSDEIVAQVRAVIDKIDDLSRLAPLKELLPDAISYGELRCVVEAVKRERNSPVNSLALHTSSSTVDDDDIVQRVVDLGEAGSSSAVPELVEALAHTNGNVRRLAASALGKIGDRRAVAPLLKLLEHESQPQVRQYAVKALGKIGDPQAKTVLQSIAQDEHEMYYTRKSALVALERLARN